jgi:subfamily B ATP-binding cassette protein MsbA
VLVLDQGRLVERGTAHELLELGGLYRQLHDAQLATSNGDLAKAAGHGSAVGAVETAR